MYKTVLILDRKNNTMYIDINETYHGTMCDVSGVKKIPESLDVVDVLFKGKQKCKILNVKEIKEVW